MEGRTPAIHVDAQLIAGGHGDPDSVLLWLQGESSIPWHSDDGWGDEPVVQELGRQISPPVTKLLCGYSQRVAKVKPTAIRQIPPARFQFWRSFITGMPDKSLLNT